MRRFRKILFWALGGIGALVGLLVVAAIAYILWLSQSVPVRGGGVLARP